MNNLSNIQLRNLEILKNNLSKYNILKDKDFELAFEYFKPLKLSRKEHFINFNQKNTRLGFVVKGVFRAYYNNEKGDEITTCFYSENDFINSEQAAISKKDSELAIQAIESSELLIISYDDLKELYLLSNNWLFLLHYLTQLAVIKSFTISKELSGKEAFEKYSYFIKSHPELINRILLQHLASYLGITKETLSRVRKKQTL